MTQIELLKEQYTRIAELEAAVQKGADALGIAIIEIERLEAENAELKKANFQQGFHIAELQGEIDLAWMATREQVAALVKPLEWRQPKDMHLHANTPNGFYRFVGGALEHHGEGVISIVIAPGKTYKQAAEAHHKETVLSLLNL